MTGLRQALSAVSVILAGTVAVAPGAVTSAVLYKASIEPWYSLSPQTITAVGGGRIVGEGRLSTTDYTQHALLWDKAGDTTSLNPASGYNGAGARGVRGNQVVGWGYSPNATAGDRRHALLWTGTAAPVELHPASGFSDSTAVAIKDGQIVGNGAAFVPNSVAHALLWNGTGPAIDLNPTGVATSYALGVGGGQQVGTAYGVATGYNQHAMLWNGTNVGIDLHPGAGFNWSYAVGAGDGQQVGYGSGTATGSNDHALLWNGTNAVTDLTPTGFTRTTARDVSGGIQVGDGSGTATGGSSHALIWTGSAGSSFDLHGSLPAGFYASEAYSIDGNTVYGLAYEYDPNSIAPAIYAVTWTIPEPASMTLAVCVIGGMLRRPRRPAHIA